MAPHRLPLLLRRLGYGLAVAVLLYMTQAPSEGLPQVDVWDKAEHGVAWLVLTGLGLALFPFVPEIVCVFAFLFGGLVELLQWLLPFGRDPDWKDWAADTVGVATALLVYGLVRRSGRWP